MYLSLSKVHKHRQKYKPKRLKHFLFAALLLLAAAVNLSVVSPAKAAEFAEHEVKAVFLYNFPNFIRWPDLAFKKDNETFTYCTFDPNENVTQTLKNIIEGEDVQGRKIQLLAPVPFNEIERCQIFYLGAGSFAGVYFQLKEILLATAQLPILTVSDITGFAQMGGTIELSEKKGRISPTINTDTLKGSDLRASSKLLRMANRVRNVNGKKQ